MRVGEFLLDPRRHRLRHFGRDWRSRLVIEVDHAAFADARPAICRHSDRKLSTSPSEVLGPKLSRRNPLAISAGRPIASSTSLFFILPAEQALPAETAIPARSHWTSKDALDAPGSEIAPIVGIRGLSSAMIIAPVAFTPSSRRRRSPASRSIS